MAQLKGILQFTGSIGNIRSYYNPKLKRYILSTKGGASKEQIENSPNFAGTRENMNEFKVLGKWASQLRKSLLLIAHLFDGSYFTEIVKTGKKIQLYDEQNPKGTRSIATSKTPTFMLINLIFNMKHPFDGVFSDRPRITLSDDKKTVTLKLDESKSPNRIHWPNRCDSYRIALVIAQLPDFVWNKAEKVYLPTAVDMEKLSVITYSEWLSRYNDPKEICLEASFASPALQIPGTTVIVAMGIELSATLLRPSDTYKSHQGTMRIVECFV